MDYKKYPTATIATSPETKKMWMDYAKEHGRSLSSLVVEATNAFIAAGRGNTKVIPLDERGAVLPLPQWATVADLEKAIEVMTVLGTKGKP